MKLFLASTSDSIYRVNLVISLLAIFSISDFWFVEWETSLIIFPLLFIFSESKSYFLAFLLQISSIYHFGVLSYGGNPVYFLFLVSLWLTLFTSYELIVKYYAQLGSNSKYKNFKVAGVEDSLIAVVGIAYLFAAIHKTNYTFLFDKSSSCAYSFAQYVSFFDPISSHPFLSWLVVGYEYLIGFLILLPRLFKFGVLFAAVFHLMLAPFELFLFSLTMLLSLNVKSLNMIILKFKFGSKTVNCDLKSIMIVSILIHATIKLLIRFNYVPSVEARLSGEFPADLVSILLIIFLGIVPFFKGIRGNQAKYSAVNIIFISFFTLNFLAPYLGLKTRESFDMNSNLYVESNKNNHVFIPNFELFDYSYQLVEILEIDDGVSQNIKDYVKKVRFHNKVEIRRALDNNTFKIDKIYLKYRYKGEVFETYDARKEFIVKELSFFEKYFISFKHVPSEERKIDCNFNIYQK